VGLAAPASADNGVTITVGKPSLTAKLLVNVPVSVVCAPIQGSTTVINDELDVTISQAASKSVSTGTSQMFGGYFYSTAGLFVCDGSTVNTFDAAVQPSPGSGPFHGGQAIITVNAYHGTDAGSESGQLGPQATKL
jgi:hypothetical protein